jgi:hypothetical protein
MSGGAEPRFRFVNCPNCDIMIEIVELNCRIFRCGIYKINYTQIPPHSTREECDRLIKNNEIYGCGKPFHIIPSSSGKPCYIIESCDYI